MSRPKHCSKSSDEPFSRERREAMRFLFDRINYERFHRMPYRERDFKLDRMKRLLEHLDHPERRFPILHIAGTKGKGSTGLILESILQQGGYRVGGFHSPHLERIEERFLIDRNPCEERLLVETILELKDRLGDIPPSEEFSEKSLTFFELTCAAAFMLFAKCRVDVAVVEVGLGGRLDATNACRPILSIITSISLEHTRELGETLEAIAREKGGIIKPEVPVVLGEMPEGPRRELERLAESHRSPCWRMPEDFQVVAADDVSAVGTDADRFPVQRFDFQLMSDRAHRVRPFGAGLGLSPAGRHQLRNAGVALMAVKLLNDSGWQISPEAVSRGMLQARCPGRAEWFAAESGDCPTILLDGAHHRESIAALFEVIDRASRSFTRRRWLFATTEGKDVDGMLSLMLARNEEICFTRYTLSPRGIAPEKLAQRARHLIASGGLKTRDSLLSVAEDPETALRAIWARSTPEDLICLAGSMYIAGQLRPVARQLQDS